MRLSKAASVRKQKRSGKDSECVCGNFHADVEDKESMSSALQRSYKYK